MNSLREKLLNDWQRDFPLVERPFEAIGAQIGTSEASVIDQLVRLQSEGVVSRVGGIVRPNTLGASTLAALAAPEFEIDAMAQIISSEPGANHVYLRENTWNLWFVITGPDQAYVSQALERISHATSQRVLDLRLEQPFHIDLGFALTSKPQNQTRSPVRALSPAFRATDSDRDLVQLMTRGIPLVSRPFRDIGARVVRREPEVLLRLEQLLEAGVLTRIGVIVRHRALGWRSNAMAVWDVPPWDVERAGTALSHAPGINLCYRRTRHEREWPYNLYCMVHAKSRSEALAVLAAAERSAGLERYAHEVLFSITCFKQTGALLALPKEAA